MAVRKPSRSTTMVNELVTQDSDGGPKPLALHDAKGDKP